MGEDLRERMSALAGERGYPGVARTLDGAIHDAWARVPQSSKPAGLRVTQTVVGGSNPIRWYGVVLEEIS